MKSTQNDVPATPEQQKVADALQALTKRSQDLKDEYSQNAKERRDAIIFLRSEGWSFRRIGDLIGVSSQRIDSMLRLGAKLAAKDAEDSLSDGSTAA